MKTKQSSSSLSYKRSVVLAIQASIAFVLVGWFSIRAIDTGSLQQYAIVVLFLAIGIFKATRAVRAYKESRS